MSANAPLRGGVRIFRAWALSGAGAALEPEQRSKPTARVERRWKPVASSSPEATVESFGLRRETTRIVSVLDLAFAVLLAAVALAHAVAFAGAPQELTALPGQAQGPLLGVGTAVCAAWLLVRGPAWRLRRRDRW